MNVTVKPESNYILLICDLDLWLWELTKIDGNAQGLCSLEDTVYFKYYCYYYCYYVLHCFLVRLYITTDFFSFMCSLPFSWIKISPLLIHTSDFTAVDDVPAVPGPLQIYYNKNKAKWKQSPSQLIKYRLIFIPGFQPVNLWLRWKILN